MELWIRSQNKEELRKIVDVKYQKGTFGDDNAEVIIATTQYDEWNILGQYKTKERALEVLDEIQDEIQHFDSENYTGNKITYVYEMPEE